MSLAMPEHELQSPMRPLLEKTCRQVGLLSRSLGTAAIHFGAAANMHCNCPDCPDPDECQFAWEEAAAYFTEVIERAEKVRAVCLEMAGEKPGL